MTSKRVFRNTLAQIGGKISTALISIFLIKVLTLYLDVEGYGLYSKIYNYLSIFAVIADLGLYTIAIREIAAAKHDETLQQKIAGTILSLRTLFGIIIVILAPSIAYFLPNYNSPRALVGIMIASWFTVFGLLYSSLLSTLQAHLKTESSFVAVTAGKITNFLLLLLVVFVLYPKNSLLVDETFQFYSLIAVMLTGLVGNMVMTAIIWHSAQKIQTVRFVFDRALSKKLLLESLPFGLALFLNVIFFKADIVILSLMLAKEHVDATIALYSVPLKIVEVGMVFGTLYLNSMLPIFTGDIQSKSKSLQDHILRSFEILLAVGCLFCALFVTFSERIVLLVANRQYLASPLAGYEGLVAGSDTILQIVAFIFPIFFLSSISTYLLVASEKQKSLLVINGVITVLNILGNILIIPSFSIVGSAFVTVGTQILLLILNSLALRKHMSLPRIPYGYPLSILVFGLIFSFFGEKLSRMLPEGIIITGLLVSLWTVLLAGIFYFIWKYLHTSGNIPNETQL